MVVSAVTTKEEARGLVFASLVTCFLVSLFAVAQIPGGERASAPFEGETGEPNTLGGYLVFMLAIVVGLLLTSGAVANRLQLLLLLVAASIGVMATLSRASFLAAGVLILIVIGVMAPRKPILMTMVLLGILSAPFFFFFQAEDGIRDLTVTGVQTCALPIYYGYQPGTLSPLSFSSVIKQGSNQTNQLTIIVQKYTIYLYINSQFIIKIDDNRLDRKSVV